MRAGGAFTKQVAVAILTLELGSISGRDLGFRACFPLSTLMFVFVCRGSPPFVSYFVCGGSSREQHIVITLHSVWQVWRFLRLHSGWRAPLLFFVVVVAFADRRFDSEVSRTCVFAVLVILLCWCFCVVFLLCWCFCLFFWCDIVIMLCCSRFGSRTFCLYQAQEP